MGFALALRLKSGNYQMTQDPFSPQERAEIDAKLDAEERAEVARKLESDKAILDSLPFGSFVEASGQVFVISAYKGKRWLYRVPKLINFKKRQKIASKARQAARDQGLLK